MYVRFISPLKSAVKSVDLGIFQCAIECRDNNEFPKYLRDAIRRDFEWFKENLPSPDQDVFEVYEYGRYISRGICWFKPEAKEMIRRCFELKFLIEECGYPIAFLSTQNPGSIRYKDEYQIVAAPYKPTPTKWN